MQVVECPRDAMQGIKEFIPTSKKVEYLNALMKVGFNVLDCTSFVSPKAIPQMADSSEVMQQINIQKGTEILSIIANQRGAEQVCMFDQVDFLGFPFSISQTFQQRNTNASIERAFQRLSEIQNIAQSASKKLLVYISMAFGNPYKDDYNEDLVADWIDKISDLGIKDFALADTIGCASTEQIYDLITRIKQEHSSITLGAHLHSRAEQSEQKIKACIDAKCDRIDGAILGFGGCPMAKDDLVGNIDTVSIHKVFKDNNIEHQIDDQAFQNAKKYAKDIFSTYH